MNTDLVVCGLAAPFDEPAQDDRALVYTRDELERFAEIETGLPVLWSHGPVIHHRGVVNSIGRAFRFALVEQGSTPAGLLALVELDDTPWGRSLADEIRTGRVTGLSLGVDRLPGEVAWPFELSICHDPAFENARIIGIGEPALSAWQLLAGERIDTTTATPMSRQGGTGASDLRRSPRPTPWNP